jgi:hypothetical protein
MDRISDAATLSDVSDRLGADPSLAATRRRDLISAVRCISEITGVDPRITPASLRHAAADQRRASRQTRPQSENLEQSLFQFPCSSCPRPPGAAKAFRSPVGGVALGAADQTIQKWSQPVHKLLRARNHSSDGCIRRGIGSFSCASKKRYAGAEPTRLPPSYLPTLERGR